MERGVEAQIKYLLDNQLIERISKKKLNINGKGRLYNQDKPPSKILTKAVGSLYKKQFPQESKPKRRIRNVKDKPAGSADVLLKYGTPNLVDWCSDQLIKSRLEVSWIEYEALQNKQTNPLVVELKFRIETQQPEEEVANIRRVYKTRNRLWWITGFKIIHKISSNEIGI